MTISFAEAYEAATAEGHEVLPHGLEDDTDYLVVPESIHGGKVLLVDKETGVVHEEDRDEDRVAAMQPASV